MSNNLLSKITQITWLKQFIQLFNSEPKTIEELSKHIRSAERKALIDHHATMMLEGVLAVSDLRVRDIMISRAEMDVLQRDAELDIVLSFVIETAHSRYPVIGDDKTEVVGMLLAKDLLNYCGSNSVKFKLRDVLRNAVFVPESKRLNLLLNEFRSRRNHMAIVIDEYGAAAGLVTIEDILEQIVGDIEDEHDFDEDSLILKRTEDEYTIKAHLNIERFNEYFQASINDKKFDTIGGFVTNTLGYLPKKGEKVIIDRFEFLVIRAAHDLMFSV